MPPSFDAGILPDVQKGDVVGDRFVLERLAGTGGMGAVFQGYDRKTGDLVAVKVLADHDAEAINRFEQEAKTLAELGHPNIVRYVAHGTTPEGKQYLVMEWLEGESLAARLDRGRLSLDEALAVATRVASALAAAHERDVVHRDIKPSNVFLVGGAADAAKVLDFGLAQAAHGAARLTRTGSVLGTPGYMAPEQAQSSKGRAHPRADVFSLGALLFECLTGRPAFQGEGVMAILARLMLEDAPRVRSVRPDVPRPIDNLVARMLSRMPEARPENGAEVLRALEGLGPGPESIAAGPPSLEPIGKRELRLVFAIVAAPVPETAQGASIPTLRTDVPPAAWDLLRRISARHGAKVSELASGAVLVLVEHGADMPTRAARLSLAVADVLPGFRVALVPGRSLLASDALASELIDRAVLLLDQPRQTGRGPRVHIDERVCALLDARFEIVEHALGQTITGERFDLSAIRPVLRNPSPFVGRTREKRALLELFEEGIEEGHPRAALVIAKAGFGKSRLAAEVIRSLSAHRPELHIAVARPDTMGTTFGMFVSTIRSLAAGPAFASEASERDAIKALLQSVGARSAERIVSLVLDTGDRMPTSAPRGPDVKELLADFLRAVLRKHPLLLVLEDAESADPSSLVLLDEVLGEEHPHPLLVLALAKPDVHDLGLALFTKHNFSEMRLGALPDKAARALLEHTLGTSFGGTEIEALLDRGRGNPFFLEELGHIVSLGQAELPKETLLGVHGAEIAELPAETRRVLRAASLVGVSFWEGSLRSILGETHAVDTGRGSNVARILDNLVSRGIAEKHRESLVPGDVEYTLVRPTFREAVLATLTSEDHRRGQLLASQWRSRMGLGDSSLEKKPDEKIAKKRSSRRSQS